MDQANSPVTRPRATWTAGVSGSTHETSRTPSGRSLVGKKTPAKKNIGKT